MNEQLSNKIANMYINLITYEPIEFAEALVKSGYVGYLKAKNEEAYNRLLDAWDQRLERESV